MIIGGSFPLFNQPSNNPPPPEDTSGSEQTDETNNQPPVEDTDTGNSTGTDTGTNTGSDTGTATGTDNPPTETQSTGDTNTANTAAPANSTSTQGSTVAPRANANAALSSSALPETVRSVVEFRLSEGSSEPSSDEVEKQARTAALDAQRAYRLEAIVSKLAEGPQEVELVKQANADEGSAQQPAEAPTRAADQVAVAPLAPALT